MEAESKGSFSLAILAFVALGIALQALQSVLFPLLLASLLAIICWPLVEALRSKRVPMALCIVAVLIIVAGVLGLVTVLLASGVQSFVEAAPRYEEKLHALAGGASSSLEGLLHRAGYEGAPFRVQDVVQVSTVTNFLAASAGSIVTLLGTILMILLFMVFLLAGAESIRARLQTAFAPSRASRISGIFESISVQIRRYVLTKTAISLLTASLVGIILLSFGVDFVLFFAMMTFFLNFIPNIGSVVATLFPVVVALLQFDSTGTVILIFVLLLVVQNLVGNLIEPKLMGRGLDLDPVVILLALIFWGWLWGIWGMVIAVPVASIVKITLENFETARPVAVLMGGGGDRSGEARRTGPPDGVRKQPKQ